MIASWKDKPLFTPGPLTTSRTIKQAMLRDLGSRDAEFIQIIRDIRTGLLELAEASPAEYTTVLVQGSGTFGIEAVLSSVIPPDGKLLVLVNGAYGERMLKIAKVLRIATAALTCPENQTPDPDALDAALAADPGITHVAVVHCETTTGIINPVEALGGVVRRHNRLYVVDAMSSFGAYPLNLGQAGVDYLVSSANKCIEGVPGFSFVLARTAALLQTAGYARSLSLDLLAQYQGLEKDGQFRFTPPTHVLLAFHQALRELAEEGGIPGRAGRYQQNYTATISGMERLGFRAYLPVEQRGYIITSFYYPAHPGFDFKQFYERLSARGQIIYPGKLSHANCFRIGHIGRLALPDVEALLGAIQAVLLELGLPVPLDSIA